MAPTKGCAVPQTITWMASASEKTSRLQLLAADIGVRNRPSAARGPKPMAPIRQPQMRITMGVRQAATSPVSSPSSIAPHMSIARPNRMRPAAYRRGQMSQEY